MMTGLLCSLFGGMAICIEELILTVFDVTADQAVSGSVSSRDVFSEPIVKMAERRKAGRKMMTTIAKNRPRRPAGSKNSHAENEAIGTGSLRNSQAPRKGRRKNVDVAARRRTKARFHRPF
jgi:hypothetical protein